MSVQTSQCETFRPEFVALLDGELTGDQAHAVRQHLKGCADCRRSSDALGKTWDLLGKLEQPRLERSLVGSIMAQVRREPMRESASDLEIVPLTVGAGMPAAAGRPGSGRGRSRFLGLFVRFSAAAAMLVGALLVRAQFAGQDEVAPAPSGDATARAVSVQVPAPAVRDVVPQQMLDIEALRSKFIPRETRFTHECDAPDPLLDVVAERGPVETRVRMENGVIMMEKPVANDLNNN